MPAVDVRGRFGARAVDPGLDPGELVEGRIEAGDDAATTGVSVPASWATGARAMVSR